MRCWNCRKTIADDAKICQFCESPVKEGPTEEERAMVEKLLGGMPPEAMEEFRALMASTSTAEEFANRIFVGDCPKCGSSDTDNCESDPEIDNLLVGRCLTCGQLFCTECENLLTLEEHECPCIKEMDDEFLDFDDDECEDEEDLYKHMFDEDDDAAEDDADDDEDDEPGKAEK